MKINILQNNSPINYQQAISKPIPQKAPSFGNIQRLTHLNLGMMGEGFIGHVELQNVTKNRIDLIPVFKSFDCGNERYFLKTNEGKLIGEILTKINKYYNYENFLYHSNPSHVLVDDLRNYSNPNTPYWNKELDYYKGVGTRLLQIAQRRSDEAQCMGNIRLNSMPEARAYYVNKIGMIKDPNNPYSGMLIIPPDKKEPLSKMYGGL